jgi:hypothetical protein
VLSIGFDFSWTWDRPARRKGFEWQEAETGEMRLVRLEGASFEKYEPLKCAGLFRDFANLSPEPAAMLRFANRHGMLGDNWDTLTLWKEGIARVKALVALWDAMADEDWSGLRSILSKLPKALFRYGIEARGAASEDLLNAGVVCLYHEVFTRVFGWTFRAISPREQNPSFVWDKQEKRVLVKLAPSSLMEAMRLQLAYAILGSKKYQQCEACGRWFELQPGVGRADKLMCSTSCRVKVYRLRRRVRDLHAAKMPIKKIATETGSDVSTIKKWLHRREEQP